MRRLVLAILMLAFTAPCFAAGPELLFLAALRSAALPAQVTGVSASNSPAQITVTWTAVSGATSYNVYYRAATDDPSGATKITGATGTSYTINGPLTSGTTYYVWMSAQNASGEGALSASASAVAADPSLNYYVQGNLTVNSNNSPSGGAGMWLRKQGGAASGYFVSMVYENDADLGDVYTLYVVKFNNGSFGSVVKSTQISGPSGLLKVSVVGSTFTAYENGTLLGPSATDATYSTGSAVNAGATNFTTGAL